MADDVAATYRSHLPEFRRAAASVQQLLVSLLEDEGVNYLSVSARAKDEASFTAKAAKLDEHRRPRYPSPMSEITDMVAARVITFLPADVDRVLRIVGTHFHVRETTDKGAVTAARGEYGYASHHLLVVLAGARSEQAEYAALRDRVVEIQVRTTLQHAWAEFEHDIRYKAALGEVPNAEVNRRFLLAAGLLELADNEFTRIDELTRSLAGDPVASTGGGRTPHRSATSTDVTGSSLAVYLGTRYPGAPSSKQEHYDWLAALVVGAGIQTLADLDDALADPPATAGDGGRSAVRTVDDELLAALGERWIAANAGAGERRVRQLRARLNPR